MELKYMEQYLTRKMTHDKVRESSIYPYRRNITKYMNDMANKKNIHDEIELANSIKKIDVENWISAMKEEYSENTINQYLSSLKPYFEFLCEDIEVIDRNAWKRAKIIRKPVTKEKEYFSLEEIRQIINETYRKIPRMKNVEFNSARMRAIIALMTSCAFRIKEVLTLTKEDIQDKGDYYIIHMDGSRIKNHTDKRVAVVGQTKKYLDEFLAIKEAKLGDTKFIFTSIKGNELNHNDTIRLMRKYCTSIGIDKEVYNHTCRATFRSTLENMNFNEILIKKVGNWSLTPVEKAYCKDVSDEQLVKMCNLV